MSEQRVVYQTARGGSEPTVVHLTLPGLPPPANNLYPSVHGRRVRSAEATAWHTLVAQTCMARHVPPFTSRKTPVRLRFGFVGMTHRRDLDGALKVLIDALAAALGFDDRYVMALSASRLPAQRTGQQETHIIVHRVVDDDPDGPESWREAGGQT